MKRVISTIVLLLTIGITVTTAFERSRVVSPFSKFDSRFLIVIDKESFKGAEREVMEYKEVLEEEGLGVTLLIGRWSEPERLRREIAKLYRKKPIIEGAVFIGDIPIVRVRNFQHATTAFKMDEERFPIEESSVTSDRFYDDLKLQFKFLEVDSNNPRIFYYKLDESSPQVVKSDFYSARLLPPKGLIKKELGIDGPFLIRRYLLKAIAAHRELNYADNIKIFNGEGYNSDCLTAWQNEKRLLKEQFPEAFSSSRANSFYNFRQDPYIKEKLMERMGRAGTDLFIFHEHGDYNAQYLNNNYAAPNTLSKGVVGPLDALSSEIRRSYRAKKSDERESYGRSLIEQFALDSTFFESSRMAESRRADSLAVAQGKIVLSDLQKVKPQAKITILDACYNGSFHKESSIAAYHLFGEGETIVVQANSANVLQDKWTLRLIGLLAEGARVGFWQKEIQTLESHLFGDPTYALTAGSRAKGRSFEAYALNKNLALNRANAKIWESYFNSENPIYQAIAIKKMGEKPTKKYEELLLKSLKESPYNLVRMEALISLIEYRGERLHEGLAIALEDSYEFNRRLASRYAGFNGHSSLVEPLVRELLLSKESVRVAFAAKSSLEMFEIKEVIAQIERLSPNDPLIDHFTKQSQINLSRVASIADSSRTIEQRRAAIRALRNSNFHPEVELLLSTLADSSQENEIRVTLAEALGWFNWSVKREQIMKKLHQIYREKGIDSELKAELEQSILRLKR